VLVHAGFAIDDVKYVDEFRDPARDRRYVEAIARITARPWTIMGGRRVERAARGANRRRARVGHAERRAVAANLLARISHANQVHRASE
jgi:hypothetical protein